MAAKRTGEMISSSVPLQRVVDTAEDSPRDFPRHFHEFPRWLGRSSCRLAGGWRCAGNSVKVVPLCRGGWQELNALVLRLGHWMIAFSVGVDRGHAVGICCLADLWNQRRFDSCWFYRFVSVHRSIMFWLVGSVSFGTRVSDDLKNREKSGKCQRIV